MGNTHGKPSDSSIRYNYDSSIETENCPPVKPPSKSRRRAIPSTEAFKAIDNHALQAPPAANQSVSSLAQYLIQPAKNDMQKVRAFYRWITNNISYDVAGLQRRDFDEQKADCVLRRRLAVCEGYCNLFLELCRESNIPCRKIFGFSKSFGYNPEVDFTSDSRTGHAWNIVYVNGQWWPIEATWGAGTVNNRKFEKKYEELYFLTDPKDFVVKHFPCEDKNVEKSLPLQLLRKPVSLEEFNRRVDIDTHGITLGYRSSTHKHRKIEVNNECIIKFNTRHSILQDVSCILKTKYSNTNCRKYVLVRKAGRRSFTVKVTPPRTGTYDLELYGKTVSDTDQSLSKMISYSLDCKSVYSNVQAYPDHVGLWGGKRSADNHKFGFSSDLASTDVLEARNGSFKFEVKIKQGSKVMYEFRDAQDKDLKKYTYGFISGGNLVIRGNTQKEGNYRLSIFGNCDAGNSYEQVADVLVESKSPSPNSATYPLPKTLWGAQADAVTRYGFTKKIHFLNTFSTDSGEIQIRVPTTRSVTSSLKLESSESGDLNSYAISFYADKVLSIIARLPKKGFYKLSLFSDENSKVGSSELGLVAELLLESKSDATEAKPFPKMYKSSETYSCRLIEPLYRDLPSNQTVRLRLRSRMLKAILIGKERYEKSGSDMFDISFQTPRFGNLAVSGNTGGDRFDYLYEFTIVGNRI